MRATHELIDNYIRSWNETDPLRRRALIEDVYAEHATYTDPMAQAHRLRQQIDASHDPQLIALLRELQALPAPAGCLDIDAPSSIAAPLQLEVGGHVLSLLSTTTVFGTPVDITLAELALEAFVPADAQTAERLRSMAG